MDNQKIGFIEIPVDYFDLSEEEKIFLISELENQIYMIIEKMYPTVNKKLVMKMIIDSSIETNITDENYEICAVLSDLRKKI